MVAFSVFHHTGFEHMSRSTVEFNKFITERAVFAVKAGRCPFITEELIAAYFSGYAGSESLGRFPTPAESSRFKRIGREYLMDHLDGDTLIRVSVPFPHLWLDFPLLDESLLIVPGMPFERNPHALGTSAHLLTWWGTIQSHDTNGEKRDVDEWANNEEDDPFKTWVYTTKENLKVGAVTPLTTEHGVSHTPLELALHGLPGSELIAVGRRRPDLAQRYPDPAKYMTALIFEEAFQRFVLNNLISAQFLNFLLMAIKTDRGHDEGKKTLTRNLANTFHWVPAIQFSGENGYSTVQYGHFFKHDGGVGQPSWFWSLGPRTPEEIIHLASYTEQTQKTLVFATPTPKSNAKRWNIPPLPPLFTKK